MISADQAGVALKEATTTEQRSAQAYMYSQSAPFCLLWGVIWIIGYGGEAFLTGSAAGRLWVIAVICGVVASIVIGRAQSRRHGKAAWRMGALFAVIWAFSAAIFAVLRPGSWLQVGAYWPLLFSAIYIATGLWLGLRYILVGLFVAASTLGAYFFLRDYFSVWMALVGGGSLMLTGLWMRQA